MMLPLYILESETMMNKIKRILITGVCSVILFSCGSSAPAVPEYRTTRVSDYPIVKEYGHAADIDELTKLNPTQEQAMDGLCKLLLQSPSSIYDIPGMGIGQNADILTSGVYSSERVLLVSGKWTLTTNTGKMYERSTPFNVCTMELVWPGWSINLQGIAIATTQ